MASRVTKALGESPIEDRKESLNAVSHFAVKNWFRNLHWLQFPLSKVENYFTGLHRHQFPLFKVKNQLTSLHWLQIPPFTVENRYHFDFGFHFSQSITSLQAYSNFKFSFHSQELMLVRGSNSRNKSHKNWWMEKAWSSHYSGKDVAINNLCLTVHSTTNIYMNASLTERKMQRNKGLYL